MKKIAFQGELGAYSHLACIEAVPDHKPVACRTFESAMEQVNASECDLAMIPIENSVAGRVADIHYLLGGYDLKIYSAVPSCDFTCKTIDGIEVPIVSDAIAYGNRKSMECYTNTYNFVLDMNEKFDGDYILHFETCITQNVYHKNVPVERFNYPYKLDGNRRIFDTVWLESGDSRVHNVNGAHSPINSKDVETTEHINPFPMT